MYVIYGVLNSPKKQTKNYYPEHLLFRKMKTRKQKKKVPIDLYLGLRNQKRFSMNC